ncbi:MAG TPA: hypothetical protein VGD99_05040 [Anaerolineae bacterium]|jgi:hypothetical protein
MAKKEEELKITVICGQCDRKFSFLLSTVTRQRAVYLGEADERLGSKLITPRTYLAPCPYCQADNEVKLP